MTIPIDAAWCAAHPLPPLNSGLDKEARGQVLIIGGSRLVPGATLLTGEAALRVGAGKVQIATVDAFAAAIGIAFPESAVIALPPDEDGNITVAAAKRVDKEALDCSVLVVGPGMGGSDELPELIESLIGRLGDDVPVLLDAGAIAALAHISSKGRGDHRQLIITPHHGELAKLMRSDIRAIATDPERAACEAAERFAATVVLKASETIIVEPGGEPLCFASGAVGLGTAGSGDVLAGAIAGLLARNAPPLTAIGWGVHAHGGAGMRAGAEIAPIGYLARDLLRFLPMLVTTSA